MKTAAKASSFRTVFCFLMVVLMASLPVAGRADAVASDQTMQELFDVIHFNELLAKMKVSMQQQMRVAFPSAPPQFVSDAMNLISDRDLMEAARASYRKNLSEEDLQAMVAFYKTPAGQHVLKAMPTMSADMMSFSLKTMQQKLPALIQKYCQSGQMHSCPPSH